MASDAMYCPAERCPHNSAGTCMAGMPLPYLMVGEHQANDFAGAITPAVLPTGLIAEGNEPVVPSWRDWRNCPHLKKYSPRT